MCVSECVCKIWLISAPMLSFRLQTSAGSILDISKYRDTCERSISILGGIAILWYIEYRMNQWSVRRYLGDIQVSSIEWNIEYRMIRFLIPKAGFILWMQIYAVYRNTQTILRTWGAFSRSPMPIYAVGIAQMPSINTPTIRVHTRRDLRRSINAIMRVSA